MRLRISARALVIVSNVGSAMLSASTSVSATKMLRHTQLAARLPAIAASSYPASRIVREYSATRARVVSKDCTFIRNGLPWRANSTSEASPDEQRISGGYGLGQGGRRRIRTATSHKTTSGPEAPPGPALP